MDAADTTVRVVEIGDRLGLVMRAVQVYAWIVFFLSWLQIGRGDWLHQKIRNSYLRYWGKFLLAGYAVVIMTTIFGGRGWLSQYLYWSYYPALLTHLAFSAAAAATLWWLRVWPAGDAKLFLMLALAYPLMSLPGDFHKGLRFLETLINTFVPAAAVLFALSLDYVYRTRFRNQKLFLASLGLRKELSYFKDQSRELWAALRPLASRLAGAGSRRAAGVLGTLKSGGIRAVADGLRRLARMLTEPGETLLLALDWLMSMALMSLVTYYLGSIVRTAVVRATLMFALFFLYGRLQEYLGRTKTLLFGSFAFIGVLVFTPDVDWRGLGISFANISVFGICIRLGMEWTLRILAGRMVLVFLSLGGLVAFPFLDYVIEPLINFAALPLLRFAAGLIPWGVVAGVSVLKGLSSTMAAFAGGNAQVSIDATDALLHWTTNVTVVSWAIMGIFFGLALVFARIWDLESYESVAAEEIAPHMLLGPVILDKLREDEEFFEEHFSDLYADGLTSEQADALREWCEENSVAQVPLAPTLSFASWIFVGYLVTLTLDGQVLRFLF